LQVTTSQSITRQKAVKKSLESNINCATARYHLPYDNREILSLQFHFLFGMHFLQNCWTHFAEILHKRGSLCQTLHLVFWWQL